MGRPDLSSKVSNVPSRRSFLNSFTHDFTVVDHSWGFTPTSGSTGEGGTFRSSFLIILIPVFIVALELAGPALRVSFALTNGVAGK